MLFELSNASSTFQAAMNDSLRPHLRKFVLVFFDDILIYNQSMSEHIWHLTTILQLLEAHRFYFKESKCVLAIAKVSYLGHIIQVGTVAPDSIRQKSFLYGQVRHLLLPYEHFWGSREFIKSSFEDMSLLPHHSWIYYYYRHLHGIQRLKSPLQN